MSEPIITPEMQDLIDAKAGKYVQQQLDASKELARLAQLAELRTGRRVYTRDNWPNYDQLPFETRRISELAIEQIAKEEAIKADAAKRAEAIDKQFRARAALHEAAEKKAQQERDEKRKAYADLRPETSEQFRGLPPEMKVKVLEVFGHDQFLMELAEKERSGYSWSSWDKLKSLDPKAPLPQPKAPEPKSDGVLLRDMDLKVRD